MSIGALSQDKKVIQKSFEDTYRVFDRLKKTWSISMLYGDEW